MKLITVSILSLTVGLFLGWSALRTAETIAKATTSRIEISLDQ